MTAGGAPGSTVMISHVVLVVVDWVVVGGAGSIELVVEVTTFVVVVAIDVDGLAESASGFSTDVVWVDGIVVAMVPSVAVVDGTTSMLLSGFEGTGAFPPQPISRAATPTINDVLNTVEIVRAQPLCSSSHF